MTSKIISTLIRLVSANANPLFQRSHIHPYQQAQIHCYQRSRSHPCQWSQINRYQLAPCGASFKSTSKPQSTSTSVVSFTPTSEAKSTTTSLLPAKPVSPLLAKPDPLLPAYSQWSQFDPDQQSRIQCNQLAPSAVRLSERWEWACQSGETKHDRALRWVSRATSTPTSMIPASRDPLLPAKPV